MTVETGREEAHTVPREVEMSDAGVRFCTPRLEVREATADDVEFIVSLWRDPRVMNYVGFPSGIPTAADDVPRRIRCGAGLTALLIAESRETGEAIGQCLLGALGPAGISEPDIKLAPAYWGQGYGRELWAALIDQLFLRSSCFIVRGTPNVANAASIRMQEAAGMKRVGEGISEFPASMRAFTTPVSYAVYEITRGEWQRRRMGRPTSRACG
jgi:RimJ/RimL family protein N-acetyltransferase